MASFSGSEVSSMISSKKYRVRKGDTLSVLADKFQGSYPSLKSMNKNSLADKIYNANKSAFGGNKDIIFEGRDLDLKFVLECRNNLKLDKSKPEYVFTDEDNLVFAIKGANGFWDDFVKIDREIGEYFKNTFRNMPSSRLPKSMPLPITKSSSSSGSSRKLMEAIGRTLSGSMVTTDQIVEAFYKLMGYNASKSEIQNCACKLEKENGTCRCSANSPCSAPRDKLEQLSCKCFEECYGKTALNSSTINDLKKGTYKVSKLDEILFAVNKDLFWNRIYQHSDDKKINEEARKGLGLSLNSLEGRTIFVATKLGIDTITVSNKPSVSGTTSTNNITRLQIIGLYANYLANSNVIKTILISDVARTPVEQAGHIYRDALNYPNINDTNAMYIKNIGKLTREWIREGLDTQEITNKITNYVIKNPTGFKHISSSSNTIDIAANNTRDTANTNFNISFKKFMTNDKLISSNNSIPKGDDGETDAYHTVFK